MPNEQAEALVKQYVPATYWAVKKYVPAALRRNFQNFECYRSVALEALLQSAKKFDPDRRVKFITYAARGMKQALWAELQKGRRAKRQGQVLWGDLPDEDYAQVTQVPSADNVAEFVDSDHLRKRVEKLLSCKKLCEKQRTLGRLLWIDGYTPREVSQRLGWTAQEIHSCRNGILLALRKVHRV